MSSDPIRAALAALRERHRQRLRRIIAPADERRRQRPADEPGRRVDGRVPQT